MSIRTSIGLSTNRDYIKAVKEAFAQAKTNIYSEKIDLAVVFSSPEYAHPAVLKAITGLLENTPLIGSSTSAIISSSGLCESGLLIMLLALSEETSLNVSCVKNITDSGVTKSGHELAEKLLLENKSIRRNLSIIFSSTFAHDGASLVGGLQEKLGISFPLVGASVSDSLIPQKSHLYFNQEVLTDAACGILLAGKLNFGLGIRHGWKPLGKPRMVTKSQGDRVEQIEGLPAVRMYEDYFAEDYLRLIKDVKKISVFYPIGINVPGEEEYLLRNVSSIGEDGSLTFQGNVPEGAQVRLMIGTKESCLNAARLAAREVKSYMSDRQIDLVFVFASICRRVLLGRQAPEELAVIKEELGKEIPIIGIYTYGEEAPLKAASYLGKTYFHNQTITILGIG